MAQLTHFDAAGASRMVDVGAKEISRRTARASGIVRMKGSTLELIRNRALAKGDVLEVGRIAGIQAAKRTDELIPLCHSLPLDSVAINFSFPDDTSVRIEAEVNVTARTGVEMEALTAVAATGLTIYDMCKSVDRDMTLSEIRLEEKSGGRSGHWQRNN
jgi:cyclic pyranopterin phosphate synthase